MAQSTHGAHHPHTYHRRNSLTAPAPQVPPEIIRPPYAETGEPLPASPHVDLQPPEAVDALRRVSCVPLSCAELS